MTRLGLTLATIAIALSSSAALASDIDDQPLRKTVSYAELDLSKSAAAEHLYLKLNAAARQVCEPVNGGEIRQKFEFRACVVETLANAVVKVNNPQLTSAYEAHEGRSIESIRLATKE